MGQLRIGLRTFGCRLNQYETDMMRKAIEQFYEIAADDSDADVFLLNACTVTGLAERKARQAARKLRREYPGCRIVVIGCIADAVSQDTSAFTDADLLAGNAWKARVVEVVERAARGDCGVLPDIEASRLETERIERNPERVRAFLKIQDGCARACTYCRTTQVRGLPRSKPVQALTEEAIYLVDAGVPEIVLTGIDLAQYQGADGNLADAVRAVASIPALKRLRLASINPSGITDDLLDAFADHDNACPHFHIPLQSGDDSILKRMQRGYATEGYCATLERIARRFPAATFGADIIVGFPGETEDAFQNTVSFVERIGFVNLHIFRYSPRAGTEAASYSDRIPSAVAQQRAAALLARWEASCGQLLDNRIGTEQDLLVESRLDGRWRGYTRDYIFASFPSEQAISIGALCSIQVTGRQGTLLEGVVNHRVKAD